ncbi:hypothetical protein CB0940_11146 [Cercospora beticola]|uniref:Uncharacterized protein n=1 Tax=Cercospora beticola TaxID=122368 RepID=A0A2G5HDK0_CERBT|nr:hypothetical protein CB0940_11146 [Cercospora beticola]PIA90599.1 hypothetical protein CB0940_11146 [Cercospora beticola]WPB07976.1 hypothetical protein RHO25_012640 [Cercospora beticola]
MPSISSLPSSSASSTASNDGKTKKPERITTNSHHVAVPVKQLNGEAKAVDQPSERPQIIGWSFEDQNGRLRVEYASAEHERRFRTSE